MTEKMLTIGSRAQVWHRTAKKTSGGLTRNHLMMNKSGRIVSKAKHNTAKRENRLLKHGYGTKKGKFGFVKIGSRKNRKGMKGGNPQVPPSAGQGAYMHPHGGSKRMKGGDDGVPYYNKNMFSGGSGLSGLSPAHVNGSYMIKDVHAQPVTPLTRALVGGKFKSGHRLNGGAAYGSGLYPADLKGSYMIKDVVPQQFSPLDRALVGGKRSKMRGGYKMKGGTGKPSLMQGSEPSSIDVQMRAGQGN
jgi:hypothetical protein